MCVSVHVGGKKALAPITAVFGDPVVAAPSPIRIVQLSQLQERK